MAHRPPLQNSKIILTSHVSKLKHGDSETLRKRKKTHCKIGTRFNRFQPFQILQNLVFFSRKLTDSHESKLRISQGPQRLAPPPKKTPDPWFWNRFNAADQDTRTQGHTGHIPNARSEFTRNLRANFFQVKMDPTVFGPKNFGTNFGYELIPLGASKAREGRNFCPNDERLVEFRMLGKPCDVSNFWSSGN